MIGVLIFFIIIGFIGMLSTGIIAAIKHKPVASIMDFLFDVFCLITSISILLLYIINNYIS